MTDHERLTALYAAYTRAKYSKDDKEALLKKGHAVKNAKGDASYPIADEEDLDNAIHAVGRGGADHDAIRAYIIGRAKALGLSSKIPDNWNADGSLKDDQSNSGEPVGEHRAAPTDTDWSIGYALEDVKAQLARVKAKQLTDPDNGSDPDDKAVMAALEEADAAIDKAITAQGKDGRYDSDGSGGDMVSMPYRSSVPAVPKRAFPSLTERPVPVAQLEVRMDGDGDTNAAQFLGYASTTGIPYQVRDWLGEYKETIQPGAFAKTLREQGDVPLLFNHDGFPMASTASGTSRLSEDSQGLRNEADLDRSDASTNTVCVQLRRGVLSKMSFSFRAVKDAWNDAYDDRAVNELALYDTSIVTYPANPSTTAELRSMFCDALGREGQSIMWSLRSAFADLERRAVPDEADPIIEQALRALAHADEVMCRRAAGPHVRARTFLVAASLEEARKGATLSKKNAGLLQTAADALTSGGKAHAKTAQHMTTAAAAVQDVIDNSGTNSSGLDGDAGGGTGGGSKNPIAPADGAGPRAARLVSVERARRQAAALRK